MIAGGVREEIQRAFVLRRFQQYLGGGAVGIVVFSALVGLGHIEQGTDAALATAVLGAAWGIIYLLRGSVVAPMVSHALFNLAQLVVYVTFARGTPP
jgi:membrane protease YdiL (CAAX protease family)